MKKWLMILICFFSCIGIVNAAVNIEDIDITININEDGSANISENWTIIDSNIKYIDKLFTEINRDNITELSVSNVDCDVYTEVKLLGKKGCEYQFVKNKLSVYAKNPGVYTISYKIDKFITKFIDVNGINYVLYDSENQLVSKFNTTIFTINGFNKNNSSLYVISDSDLKAEYEDNHIIVLGKDISRNSKIRFMTPLTGVEFTKKIKSSKKFIDVYHTLMNKYLFEKKIKSIIRSRLFIFGISGGILLIIYLILNKIINKNKRSDDYYGIIPYNKIRKIDLNQISYYDDIPCSNDLYKIFFIAGYYGFIKNKSDLIGAFLLKWNFEGLVKIDVKQDNSKIILESFDAFKRPLDLDLYNILLDASNNNVIDSNKLIKYSSSHYLKIMTWYNMGFSESINKCINDGYIKKKNIFRKFRLEVQKEMYDEAVLIAGLKKYLLNFNQVPRKTELTEQKYKYLLIIAEMLGIGKQVSEEILRKNPDNYMAKLLLNLENSKYLFKKVHEVAYTPYKDVVKNKKMQFSYDQELERLSEQKSVDEKKGNL